MFLLKNNRQDRESSVKTSEISERYHGQVTKSEVWLTNVHNQNETCQVFI